MTMRRGGGVFFNVVSTSMHEFVISYICIFAASHQNTMVLLFKPILVGAKNLWYILELVVSFSFLYIFSIKINLIEREQQNYKQNNSVKLILY